MEEIRSGLNKKWEQISNLVNNLTAREQISQIDVDILLENLRGFYQDIYDLNKDISFPLQAENALKTSDSESIQNKKEPHSEENTAKSIESKLIEKPDVVKDEVFEIAEEKVLANEKIIEQQIEEITHVEIPEEQKKIMMEVSIEEIAVSEQTAETIPIPEIFEEQTQNPFIQQTFIQEEISQKEFSQGEANVSKNSLTSKEIIQLAKGETQVHLNGHGQNELIQEKPLEDNFFKTETITEPPTTVRREENKQPSLFEYLQSNNMEQISQNVSELINAKKPESNLTIGDTFKQEQPSIFEKITPQNQGYSVEEKIQKQVILDFRDVIGINEKFMFINELFSGNMKEYTDFILLLNTVESKEEVEQFLLEIKNKRVWTGASHAYSTLLQIVKRKF